MKTKRPTLQIVMLLRMAVVPTIISEPGLYKLVMLAEAGGQNSSVMTHEVSVHPQTGGCDPHPPRG